MLKRKNHWKIHNLQKTLELHALRFHCTNHEQTQSCTGSYCRGSGTLMKTTVIIHFFIYIINKRSSLFVSIVDMCGFDARLNAFNEEFLSFFLSFALITAPTHYGQTHTNAPMPPAGYTCQNAWRDKTWWKAPRSNKRKVPLFVWEPFGLSKKKSDETLQETQNLTKPETATVRKKKKKKKKCRS